MGDHMGLPLLTGGHIGPPLLTALSLIPNPHPLAHTRRGSGAPVILLHGLIGSQRDWQYLAPALAHDGYETITVDLPAHGESAWLQNPHEYSIETFYQQVAAWYAGLNLREPALWIGHSTGGYLSLLVALRQPAWVRGLFLVAPLCNLPQVTPLLQHSTAAGFFIRYAPRLLIAALTSLDVPYTEPRGRQLRLGIARDYKRTSPYAPRILKGLPDLLPQAGAVHQRAAVLWGRNDRTLAPACFAQLAGALPNGQAIPLRRGGHHPHLAIPQTVNEHTLNFLQAF
ncbi:MAG: alpha/beta hydrolase [Anaerolineales bacterium]